MSTDSKRQSFTAKLAAKLGGSYELIHGWNTTVKMPDGRTILVEEHGMGWSSVGKKFRCKASVDSIYVIKAKEPYTLVPFDDLDETVALAALNLTAKVLPKAKELDAQVQKRNEYQQKVNQQRQDAYERFEKAKEEAGYVPYKEMANGLDVRLDLNNAGSVTFSFNHEIGQIKDVLELLGKLPPRGKGSATE